MQETGPSEGSDKMAMHQKEKTVPLTFTDRGLAPTTKTAMVIQTAT